jgi:protocatechuate 3,4-dioxygenase beta subunit
MKRAVAVAVVAALAIAAIVVVKCGGSGGGSRTAGAAANQTGAGTGPAGDPARAAREPAPDPRTAVRASLHGTVTAKGGGPIAGAQVCTTGQIEKVASDETRDPRCTRTDAAGAYTLDQLYPGRYTVRASARQYLPGVHHKPPPDHDDTEVVLTAGQRRDGVDIALAPGGVEVKGIVSDINGGPIAEAWVEVSSGGWWSSNGDDFARSAADGTFTAWVEPGSVTARATADGYAEGTATGVAPTTKLEVLLTPESVLAGIVVDAETSAPVPGATVSIERNWSENFGSNGTAIAGPDGRFRITRLSPGRYKPAATALGRWGEAAASVLLGLGQTVEDVEIRVHAVRVVTGRIVIDSAHTPAPAATAQTGSAAAGSGDAAKPSGLPGCPDGWLWLSDRNDRSFSARTDATGAVRIEAIIPGSYRVWVSCEDHVSEDPYPDLVVGDADVIGREWRTHAGSKVSGTVRTTAGAPIAEAQINVRTVGGDPRGQRGWGNATTDDTGRFEMRGVLPGGYHVEVVADGHPNPKEPPKLEVAAGVDATIDIVLDDGGTIAGIVVDDAGTPVTAARVEASGDRWEWRGDDTRTGDDGTFTIEGLRAGSYRVQANRGWRTQMRKPGSTDDDVQGERATVVAGQTARVRIVVESQTGTIAGTVVDAANQPVADAFLSAERESDGAGVSEGASMRQSRWGSWGIKPVVTDAAGAFKITNLSPGKYTIRAYRRGGGEAFAEHVPVGSTKARLTMKPTGAIAGVVVIAGGGAPPDVEIEVRDDKGGFSRSERFFRTHGAFTIDELPAGSFRISANAVEGMGQATATLGDGERKTGVAIELAPRVRVTGRVVALDGGAPVPGMQMIARPVKGGVGMVWGDNDNQSITGADGRFVIADAPAGRITLQGFPVDWDQAVYGGVTAVRTLQGGGEVDVGDLVAPKRRVPSRDTGGDLGFDTKDQPPDTEPEDARCEVSHLRPGGPAVSSGLKVGDVITTVDGHDISGVNSYLRWTLLRVPVGTEVTLGLERGATVKITAGPQP